MATALIPTTCAPDISTCPRCGGKQWAPSGAVGRFRCRHCYREYRGQPPTGRRRASTKAKVNKFRQDVKPDAICLTCRQNDWRPRIEKDGMRWTCHVCETAHRRERDNARPMRLGLAPNVTCRTGPPPGDCPRCGESNWRRLGPSTPDRWVCRSCRTRHDRQRLTGWSSETFEVQWIVQRGRCQMCDSPMTRESHHKNSAHADHDHKTGKVRGILCSTCNTRLGILENAEFVAKATVYLERWK